MNTIHCLHCNHKLNVSEVHVGENVTCPNCAGIFQVAQDTNDGIALVDPLIDQRDGDRAFAEASKIKRLDSQSPHTHNVADGVGHAGEQYKHDLKRRFLAAAQKHKLDEAMELLKVLDTYLTPSEAEPLRETVRSMFGEKSENLCTQFKTNVYDKQWPQAIRTGEQIIREFPNSKMAREVRSLLDLLNQRVAEQQASQKVPKARGLKKLFSRKRSARTSAANGEASKRIVIKFRCTQCHKRITARDHFSGSKVKCPRCWGEVVVPYVDTIDDET